MSDAAKLESIVDDFTRRIRAGEHPAIVDYQAQHPELSDEIEDLLASVAMIENLKSNPTQPPTSRQSLDGVSSLTQIGDYQIVSEIGRGGMGIVFEAIHQSLGRRVAIKVMPNPLVNREKYVERFKRESQSAARLHHTNIVGVFGIGEGDGYHYYVMDFVDGQTLSEIVFGLAHANQAKTHRNTDRTRLDALSPVNSRDAADSMPDNVTRDTELKPNSSATNKKVSPTHFRWAARIGANVADALAYAHDSKILHRDIKPSNIILDRKGGVWITDFGLAKDSSSEINLTKTGDVIGTPQYLAPESLQGNYDQRSEVYCVGLTLYELVTLQPAYKSGTTAEVLGAIASSSPVSPRKLNPQIPIDLSTIIDKAVSRDPSARYQTADDLRKDLLAFVEDRPISARPPSTIENVIKWSRRNPLTAALSAISGLLLLLVAVSATVGYLYTIDALTKEADKSAKLLHQQKETELQRQVAVEERKKMQVEFDRAEANIEITLKAFDEMFKQVVSRGSSSHGDISLDGFEELTGIETSITREDAAFLDSLLVFYDQFAKQNVENDSLRIESARAFRRVANIYQLIGDSKKAIDAYQNSIEGYEAALKLSPDSKEILIALVNTKCEISSLHRRQQNWREAIDQNRSAIYLLENVPVDQIDNELKLELAKTLNSLGSSSALIAAFERDRPSMFEEMAKRLSGRPPPRGGSDDRKGRPDAEPFDRASSRNGPPDPRNESGRPPRPGTGGPTRMIGRITSHYTRDAIELLDELIEEDPTNVDYLFARANCYCSLAATMFRPEPDRARRLRDDAIRELESLIKRDPENHEYQYRLALTYSLSDRDRPQPEETELLKKSVAIVDSLAESYPQFLDYHVLRIAVHASYAGRLTETAQFEEALNSLRDVLPSVKQVAALARTTRSLRSGSMVLFEQITKLSKAADANGLKELARSARSLQTQLKNSARGQNGR